MEWVAFCVRRPFLLEVEGEEGGGVVRISGARLSVLFGQKWVAVGLDPTEGGGRGKKRRSTFQIENFCIFQHAGGAALCFYAGEADPGLGAMPS